MQLLAVALRRPSEQRLHFHVVPTIPPEPDEHPYILRWLIPGIAQQPRGFRQRLAPSTSSGARIFGRQQRLRLVPPRIMVRPPRAAARDKKRRWGVAKR
ncbi:MAG: hypothetical protein CR217_10925 [Beijerinckiaceae bacterium]|nr:MAG: hypothetical protein CR217_10925 [Beijerinckiaceae bacterium]